MERRLRTIGLVALLAGGVAYCRLQESASLPTEPASDATRPEESLATGPSVPRMAIIRARRSSPSATVTPTIVRSRTPTLTRTSGSTVPPTTTSTRTRTPTPTGPSPTATRTRTPTPGGTINITLRAVRWAWQWIGISGPIHLKSGGQYRLKVYNGDIPDPDYQPHFFSGILEFGVSGAQLPWDQSGKGNGPPYIVTFTAPVVTQSTSYGFSCTEFYCGPVTKHESMLGTAIVDP